MSDESEIPIFSRGGWLLNQLTEITGGDREEVIRNAVRLYEAAAVAKRNGAPYHVRKKDGYPQEINLLGLASVVVLPSAADNYLDGRYLLYVRGEARLRIQEVMNNLRLNDPSELVENALLLYYDRIQGDYCDEEVVVMDKVSGQFEVVTLWQKKHRSQKR